MKTNKLVKFFRRIYYWFLHRLHPKYRYHVLRTGLSPGFHEPDIRLIHAVFGLVSEFVEASYWFPLNEGNAVKELEDLKAVREYWRVTRPKIVDSLRELWDGVEKDGLLAPAALKAQDELMKLDKIYLHKAIERLDYLWD